MTPEEIDEALAANATGPKKVQVGNTATEAHPLLDQIATSEHLANKAAAASPARGIRFGQFIPPGCGG